MGLDTSLLTDQRFDVHRQRTPVIKLFNSIQHTLMTDLVLAIS